MKDMKNMKNMKKYLFVGLGITFIIASIIFIRGNITEMAIQENKILLGYCPSMESTAQAISKQNHNIDIIRKDSTINILESLKSNEIDVALVGRIAKASELPDNNQRMLSPGYTLVSNTKKFIQKTELKSLTVHTSLNQDIAENILPESNIFYYDTLGETIVQGMNHAVLIDWKDYRDHMELVVVMDGELKDLTFRVPILYSIDYNLNNLRVEA